ncbi:MAG: PP2C family protein-serine/threonine phosphatase [Anaerolineae bacterium]|nr:PP2C family protein-serine/threonine phosphatase [Anaerolineae bacterium]
MDIEVAVAKVPKWASPESGDTLEMIERPRGGFSFVLVDGQGSGRGAKAVSQQVARKAIAELAEGVRDGAAARAAHDFLYTQKGGRVSATLNILSVDLTTGTLVLSRNNPHPVIVVRPDGTVGLLDEPSQPVGIYPRTRPVITEVPLEPGLTVVVYTDGLARAGEGRDGPMDLPAVAREMAARGLDARQMADELLARALTLEASRPRDDISVLVLRVHPATNDPVRRLHVQVSTGT